jgi:hypothetical protein
MFCYKSCKKKKKKKTIHQIQLWKAPKKKKNKNQLEKKF